MRRFDALRFKKQIKKLGRGEVQQAARPTETLLLGHCSGLSY